MSFPITLLVQCLFLAITAAILRIRPQFRYFHARITLFRLVLFTGSLDLLLTCGHHVLFQLLPILKSVATYARWATALIIIALLISFLPRPIWKRRVTLGFPTPGLATPIHSIEKPKSRAMKSLPVMSEMLRQSPRMKCFPALRR
jgi:hypothetical protein